MEKFTTLKAATSQGNGSLSRLSTFEGKNLSLSSTSFVPPRPKVLDVSFTSFVPPKEHQSVTHERIGSGVVDDTEISIFQAERYFNESQEQKRTNKASSVSTDLDIIVERRYDFPEIQRFSSVSSVDGCGRNYRTGSFHSTPTASSEASWNSQSGLLSNPPGSIAVSMRNLELHRKKNGSSSKWFFGRKCPCSGKKSVQVEEKLSEPKAQNGSLNPKKQSSKEEEICVGKVPKDKTQEKFSFSPENHFPAEIARRVIPSGRSFNEVSGFSFPILTPPAAGKLLLNSMKPVSQLEEQPRESLEIFQPAGESTQRKSTDQIQLRMLMPFQRQNNNHSKARMPEDDVASDASSDLFEIESFSTQTTTYPVPMYVRRDSLDEMSSIDSRLFERNSLDETTTPTELYAPSEASIEWSVTTAEGFDRGSIANFSTGTSDFEEIGRLDLLESKKLFLNGIGGASKRKGNGLLGCQCEKAVNVGPHPVKFLTEQQRVGPAFTVESDRIQATLRGSGKPPLSRSHCGRVSRTLTTH